METAVLTRPNPNIVLMRHQAQALNAPWNKQLAGIDYFILHAGYASGKTFLDCMLALNLVRRYHAYDEVIIGVGGTTRVFLEKTMLYSLFQIFRRFGIPYDWNGQSGIITVNKMQFICIGTDQPGLIYGYNFNAFLWDEPDELPFEKTIDSFVAINERARVPFPDGRNPFKFLSSTAQGLKGLYQIITDLAERKRPHVLIRGETLTAVKAGFLPRVVYEEWLSMYTDNEKLAFLEGRFVSITTGRCYYEYDENIHRLKTEPFEILPSDDIWVGQDLNAGFSYGTAYVKRVWADPRFPEDKPQPTLFAVRSWNFGEIGNAPRIMRNDFPQNDIYWYPDATGNEILAGYRSEMLDAGIKLRTGTVNPHVVDRIFVMNKMFKLRRMYLFPKVAPLSLGLKVRQYDESGKPEKGKGPQAPDHPCFAAGTLISTAGGQKPIEVIKAGDLVLTRKGPRRVIDVGVTGLKDTRKYRVGRATLDSTPDHPIFTERGFVAIAYLMPSNILCTISKWESKRCENLFRIQKYLTELSIEDIRTARTRRISTISAALRLIGKLTKDIFIGRYGSRRMGPFLMVTIFITAIETLSTTIWTTSNASIFMLIEGLQSKIQKSLLRTCERPRRRQRLGIAVQKVVRGILSMREKIRQLARESVVNALNVASHSMGLPILSSVPESAFQSTGEIQESIMNGENAPGAAIRLESISMPIPSAVANHALHSSEAVPVYDITVEDQHEYFANGILVSNCDSAEYVVWRRIQADYNDFKTIWTATRAFHDEQAHGKRFEENVLDGVAT